MNCTCATTGFCPRGVGVHIKKDETDLAAASAKPLRNNQTLREQLQKLPKNRKQMRY
ncbi:MAG TPA: hypothetical protein VFW68_03905 [Rhodocyclaceae bacterium]|nr:hypothetical protein [Rhodocyclaceae bacterium]